MQAAPWDRIRWLVLGEGVTAESLFIPQSSALGWDTDGRLVAVFQDQWDERSFRERNAKVELLNLPDTEPPMATVGRGEAANSQ